MKKDKDYIYRSILHQEGDPHEKIYGYGFSYTFIIYGEDKEELLALIKQMMYEGLVMAKWDYRKEHVEVQLTEKGYMDAEGFTSDSSNI